MAYISKLSLKNFTAFGSLDIDFNPLVNVFLGTNGTGKTHVMKLLYSACSFRDSAFAEKLLRVFMPDQRQLGRLVHRKRGLSQCSIEVQLGSHNTTAKVMASFSSMMRSANESSVVIDPNWSMECPECAYVPVKEMLTHAPGFLSVYDKYELQFEEVYPDILRKAQLPPIKGRPDSWRQDLLDKLRDFMEGTVLVEGEKFFHDSSHGKLEFALLSEGLRKLGLLWVLIQNGTLTRGSVLFWDEPEANLNPEQSKRVVELILELQRQGTQVFVATHDYTILKWFDLCRAKGDSIQYHSFYRVKPLGELFVQSTYQYDRIEHNPILPTFDQLYKASVGIKTEDKK
jgi:predicted ATPase